MQTGMLLVSDDTSVSDTYVSQVVGYLDERLDVNLFRKSWTQLAARHAVLRTRLQFDRESGWTQAIHSEPSIPIRVEDWQDTPPDRQTQAFDDFLRRDKKGFSLGEESPSRVNLFILAGNRFRMVWTYHHALLDGRSQVFLLKELMAIYDATLHAKPIQLPGPVSYDDYLTWSNGLDAMASRPFWQENLSGSESITTVLKVRAGQPVFSSTGKVTKVNIQLPESITAKLYDFVGQYGLTVNTVSLGAWALLVSCYTGEDDVLLGAVRSCRRSLPEHIRPVAGLVINTIPFRIRLSADQSIIDSLERIRSHWLALRPHELSPVHSIRKWCDWPATKPMFSSLHVHDHQTVDRLTAVDLGPDGKRQFRLVHGHTEAAVSVSTYGGPRFGMLIQADETLFAPTEVEQIGSRYRSIIEQMIRQPDKTIDSIDRLTPWEHQRLMVDFNQHPDTQRKSESVIATFRRQAYAKPDNPALVAEGMTLSYQHVLEAASTLAQTLERQGHQGPLAILIGPEPDFVIALLASLILGSGFLPLDPEYPRERIAFMLKDCAARTLVTQQRHRDCATQAMGKTGQRGMILALKALSPAGSESYEMIGLGDTHSLPPYEPANDLVYIVYTSGTSGQPKGVPVTNRNLMPLMYWQAENFHLGNQIRTAQTLSVSFDFGLQEIFTTLLFGGTLYYPPASIQRNAEAYVEYLQQNRINMVYSTPSYLQSVLSIQPRLDSLRILLLGGERLSWSLVDNLRDHIHADCLIYNGYGPTEATINCAMYNIGQDNKDPDRTGSSVPIGRPTGQSRLYVLDGRLRPTPMGVAGELYIGGPGVASGYLGRPFLSKQKFLIDPFAEEPGWMMYRTGDQVVHRPDGFLEFLGRLDRQVKVRGYRIEPEEIEYLIVQHPGLAEVAAVAEMTEKDNQQIILYAVAKNQGLCKEDIRRFAHKHLPHFMVPAKIRLVGSLPLTDNGKIDYAGLHTLAESLAKQPGGTESGNAKAARASYDQWFYEPVWQPADRADQTRLSKQTATQVVWLLFADQASLASHLHTELDSLRQRVIKIIPSGFYSLHGHHTCHLDPGQRLHYERLFRELLDNGQYPGRILFQCSYDGKTDSGVDGVDKGLERLLYLLQVIGKYCLTRDLQLGIITVNAQMVTGDDLLHPRQALLTGLCKAIPYEFPRVRWTSIDLDQNDTMDRVLAQNLISDISQIKTGLAVAYRGGSRHILHYRKLSPGNTNGTCRIRGKGVYLITGGLGAIGLELAETLVQKGASNLALMDTPPTIAGISEEKKHRLVRLENLGCEVLTVSADICDQSRVATALQELRYRFGNITGVIHAAGLAEFRSLGKLTVKKLTRILAPKVQGTEILAAELAPDPLDFVLLCSSIDAVRGNFGQADYCAANNFEDAFANSMNQNGRPFITVNWDVWQEVGMAAGAGVSPAMTEYRRQERGMRITPAEGRRVLDTVLSLNLPQVVVSTTDLNSRIVHAPRTLEMTGLDPSSATATFPVETDSIEEQVLQIYAAMLQDMSIKAEDDFFRWGGDSLSAMQVVMQLRDQFSQHLPMSSVFDAPTASKMAELLTNLMEQQ